MHIASSASLNSSVTLVKTFCASFLKISHTLPLPPLNAVLGFSQIMRRNPETTEAQRESLGIIARSGEHLLAMINAVLDISKIEAGRAIPEPENFDLGELIRDVTDMMRSRAEDKNLELVLDQSSEFPRYVHCDPAKLRQILVSSCLETHVQDLVAAGRRFRRCGLRIA